MSKVLITGASGFLGKTISEEIKKSCVVTELSRSKGEFKISLEKGIPCFKQDFDLIIHAAGKAHSLPQTKNDKSQFHQVNVIGTNNLLTALEETNFPKSFVFISTVAVYGVLKGEKITENVKLSATDPYGKSKIEAEKLVLAWCNKNGVKCTILRLPLVVGNNPPGNLGSMMSGIKSGLYFNIGGGKAKKSMVLVEDIAKFVLKSAEVGGTYNLTDGYHPSFSEFSENIAKQFGKPKPYNIPKWIAFVFALVGDIIGKRAPINRVKYKKIISDLTFDDSKARISFGWKPTSVLEGFKIKKQ